MYCSQISDLISSIIIYLCGFVLFIKYAMNNMITKRENRAAQAVSAGTEDAEKKGGEA